MYGPKTTESDSQCRQRQQRHASCYPSKSHTIFTQKGTGKQREQRQRLQRYGKANHWRLMVNARQ
jgi:hypothetical protein